MVSEAALDLHEAGIPQRSAREAPKNAAERLEYLTDLATAPRHWVLGYEPWRNNVRERMAQAAQVWTLEVAEASEESREMLAIAHDRIAQLEETVERLGADLANARFRLDEARQNAQAASERHAIQSGEQRQTIAALAAQLVREMRRGGA